MNEQAKPSGGLTGRGKLVLTVLLLGVVGFAAWTWREHLGFGRPASTSTGASTGTNSGSSTSPPSDSSGKRAPEADTEPANPVLELVETQREVPRLAPPGIYRAKGDVIEVELSEYAGYAGLIAANGGLEPNEQSYFSTRHKLKLRLTLSEEESWSKLNSGGMAASATTADVLAVYGKQFQVIVPAQIGFSRGADGVVVANDLKRINQLAGRVLAASQFTEADFFIRYLAQEAGLAVNMLDDLNAAPSAEALNLVYCADAFAAGDAFLAEVLGGSKRLHGCVTWDPKTSEVVAKSAGKARLLATNANLLIVADILIVNQGFASEHPEQVLALVDGLLAGNRMVRDEPERHVEVIGKAFGWSKAEARAELQKVHLANLPENQAFFSGAIDAAGSFGALYQSSVFAYGPELVQNPVDAEHFVRLDALNTLAASGAYADQKIAIQPIVGVGSASVVEGDPLLSKNIRFLFDQNVTTLDLTKKENETSLDALAQLLRVSPGSTILLRGHVDNAMEEQFRRLGGDAAVRQQRLTAVQLSKDRAAEVRRHLIERHQIQKERVDIVGRGWDEPISPDPALNRRVEAQWFMAR